MEIDAKTPLTDEEIETVFPGTTAAPVGSTLSEGPEPDTDGTDTGDTDGTDSDDTDSGDTDSGDTDGTDS